MSVNNDKNLSCWQSFLNCFCCGYSADDSETKRQKQPLLPDRPPRAVVVHSPSKGEPPLNRTQSLSAQQYQVIYDAGGASTRDVSDGKSDRRSEPKKKDDSPKRSELSPQESHTPTDAIVSETNLHESGERSDGKQEKNGTPLAVPVARLAERAVIVITSDKHGSGTLPRPDSTSFASTTPPETAYIATHIDTPYFDRAQSNQLPPQRRGSDESTESVASTPPNSDVHGTPVSSPMSNKDKSPSKVLAVSDYIHPTSASEKKDGNESD